VGQSFNITGVNYYAFGEYNIEPRMASDVEFASGIADAGVLNTVTLGPNPASNLIVVSLGQAPGSKVDFTLTDMQGRMVQMGSFSGSQGRINVDQLATGTYQLMLTNAKLAKTFAVQVAR
jgi:hypothetical protein